MPLVGAFKQRLLRITDFSRLHAAPNLIELQMLHFDDIRNAAVRGAIFGDFFPFLIAPAHMGDFRHLRCY